MLALLIKIYLKAMRSLGMKSLVSIKSGHLKGLKWHTSVPDNRYIIGNYEPALADLVKKAVIDNKRFIDIGSNAGYFSLLAAKYGKSEQDHIAVEPNPENLQILKSHILLNKIDNISIEEIAVSNKAGTIKFSDSGNLAANTYKTESSIYQSKTISVLCNTVDYIAEKYSLDSKTLLKIDVEGAELDVLQGGMDFIKKHHPEILLATHNCHVPHVMEDCLEILEGIGYRMELIEDNKIPGQADFKCTYISS